MRGAHPHHRLQAQAHGVQVDAGRVACNHARVFELFHTLAHRRLRQADLLAQRRQALPRVVLQGHEDLPVFFVQFHGVLSLNRLLTMTSRFGRAISDEPPWPEQRRFPIVGGQ
ncbi:hypothetical protein D3C72_2067750 [compost metagenome]